jgi:hypothetical protein
MPGRFKRQKPKGGRKKDPAFQKKVNYFLQRLETIRGETDSFPGLIKELLPGLEADPTLAEAFLSQATAQKEKLTALFLSRLKEQAGSSALRRRIKGALYQLTQQGLEVPGELENEKAGPAILRQAESLPLECYLSDFDPLGSRMLTLVVPRAPQGRILVFALANWDQGLEDLTALEVSKRQVRPLLEESQENSGYPFYPSDPNQAVFLLREAYERSPALKTEDKKVYSVLMNYLETMGPFSTRPIIRDLIPGDEQENQAGGDWESLKSIPELLAFQLPSDRLSSCAQQLEEIKSSPLILNAGQQKERLQAVIQQAAADFFTPPRVENFHRYLEEIAYLYWLKAEPERFRVLVSAAARLESETLNREGRESPLLAWLFEKEFQEIEEENDGLAEESETRTEGGLILPHWVKK